MIDYRSRAKSADFQAETWLNAKPEDSSARNLNLPVNLIVYLNRVVQC